MSAYDEFCGCGEYSCGECFSGHPVAVGNAWFAAVDENARRIAGYNGEYGVPDRGPQPSTGACECGCGLECHDLIGELGECLECDDCRRYRPVTP
jgi:hypothetical protein